MTESLVENFNRRLRSDFAGFRAADAIGDGENLPLLIV
jgi:hypothetical protein